MILKETEALVIDCQATSPKPDPGNLLELGWANVKPARNKQIFRSLQSHLIQSDQENTIPRHVQKITGIREDELKSAVQLSEVWSKFYQTAIQTAQLTGQSRCFTIIHFASYEEPFLRQLHEKYHPQNIFPFEIICTHKISKILFQALPRKGLRAVAGYLGFSLPEQRRCQFHVEATGFIWCRLVEILEHTHGIHTHEDLIHWISSTQIIKGKPFQYPLQQKLRQDLPDVPGIYRMLRSNGALLYIGKSKSLKKRVNSYYHQKAKHAEHILEMLTQAQDLNYQTTPTVLAAAILESDEIQKYSPPYNIALKNRNQELIFYSKDFIHKSLKPDDYHRVGPIPNSYLFQALEIIRQILNNQTIIWEEPLVWGSAFHQNPVLFLIRTALDLVLICFSQHMKNKHRVNRFTQY